MTNPTIILLDHVHNIGVDQEKDFHHEGVWLLIQMLIDLEAA